jgi:hypothetical protein
VAKPLTADERADIIALLGEGLSANEIARRTRRSTSTVSGIAKTIGHRFGQSNVAHAHEARSAYSAERRAELAARATVEAERLLDRMSGSYVVFNFGGRDNTYEEHTFTEPPVDAMLNLMRAFREAMRTVLDIDRHDNRNDEGLAAVDQWLRDIAGGT